MHNVKWVFLEFNLRGNLRMCYVVVQAHLQQYVNSTRAPKAQGPGWIYMPHVCHEISYDLV